MIANRAVEQKTLKDIPSQNSKNYYCGWFVKWFYLLNFQYKLSYFKESFLPSVFPGQVIVEEEDKGNKEINSITRAWRYAKTSRTRWCNFFESLWNHPAIQELLDPMEPKNTKVEDEKDGLGFITETIARHIFNKVFYETSVVPSIVTKGEDDQTHMHLGLKLFRIEG